MSFDGRSSSASSIDSTGSFETLQDPRDLKLQRLEAENLLLRRELMDKRTEAQELKESTLKTQISGAWKIVASRNVEEFFEQHPVSELNSIVFQVADIHFQFDDSQKVTVFHKIGNKRYNEYVLKFGELTRSSGGLSSTYFTEKSIKTVCDELAEQEISIEDGSLKIVEKVGGVKWERVYRRKTEEDPTNVEDLTRKVMELKEEIERLNVEKQSAEEMVEKLQGDSKQMFQCYKNLVAMFLAKNKELDTQQKGWMAGRQEFQQLVDKLQKDLKEQRVELDKKCKESVEQNDEITNLKEQSLEKDAELENLKSTVLEIKEENEKFQQTIKELQENQKKHPNSQRAEVPDIRRSITGTWRDKKDDATTVHFKVDSQGNILQKWNFAVRFTEHIPGVRNADGWCLYFENNRLVKKCTNSIGTTIHQVEWFLEDGDLIWTDRFSRKVFKKV